MEDDIQTDLEAKKSGKPRRLEADTATYLIQLEGRLQLLSEAKDHQEVEILIMNVLEEVQKRIGSAMSDRRTNAILEKIALLSSMRHILLMMSECSPYVLFLATNRHSAHCLQVQTLLFVTLL
jgi:hypothetical protein